MELSNSVKTANNVLFLTNVNQNVTLLAPNDPKNNSL
jgi:hypothetical protein